MGTVLSIYQSVMLPLLVLLQGDIKYLYVLIMLSFVVRGNVFSASFQPNLSLSLSLSPSPPLSLSLSPPLSLSPLPLPLSLLLPRYNFPESLSVIQFVVCASLGELEHKKRKRGVSDHETDSGSGLKIALLDSEHKVCNSCTCNVYLMTPLLLHCSYGSATGLTVVRKVLYILASFQVELNIPVSE